jgi:hypothetical protein
MSAAGPFAGCASPGHTPVARAGHTAHTCRMIAADSSRMSARARPRPVGFVVSTRVIRADMEARQLVTAAAVKVSGMARLITARRAGDCIKTNTVPPVADNYRATGDDPRLGVNALGSVAGCRSTWGREAPGAQPALSPRTAKLGARGRRPRGRCGAALGGSAASAFVELVTQNEHSPAGDGMKRRCGREGDLNPKGGFPA